METADQMTTLHQLAAELPYRLNDSEEVNRRFLHSMEAVDEPEDPTLDLWTYLYVRRYFLIKFAKDPTAPIADFDMIVETTYVRIQRGKERMRDYSRYANWVSVICKNTFLNYIRSRKKRSIISIDDYPELEQEEENGIDTIFVRSAVDSAIERLPDFLRDVARMRFQADISYEEMSRRSGKSVPTIRSYVNKVLNRFRRDKRLISLIKDQVIS